MPFRNVNVRAIITLAVVVSMSTAGLLTGTAAAQPTNSGDSVAVTFQPSSIAPQNLIGRPPPVVSRPAVPSTARPLGDAERRGWTTGNTYVVDSAKYDTDAVQPLVVPNVINLADCRARPLSPNYFIRDHYALCLHTVALATFSAFINGVKTVTGTTTFTVTMIGVGGSGTRDIVFSVAFDDFSTVGDTNDAPFTFNIRCLLVRSTDTCRPSAPAGESNSVAGWQAQAQPQFQQVLTTTTPVPLSGDRDGKGYFDFVPSITDSEATTPLPTESFRCDNVTRRTYIRYGGCIFDDVQAVFQLDATAGSGVTESARFIRDAQRDVTVNTKPGIPGTYVPSIVSRRYSGYDTANLGGLSQTKSRATCLALPPRGYGPLYTLRPGGGTNDCDEYPFAATYEDSITVPFQQSARSYAVRPVLSGDNQAAGRRVVRFTTDDHILDRDPYRVLVVGG